jgi:hypothetical protein
VIDWNKDEVPGNRVDVSVGFSMHVLHTHNMTAAYLLVGPANCTLVGHSLLPPLCIHYSDAVELRPAVLGSVTAVAVGVPGSSCTRISRRRLASLSSRCLAHDACGLLPSFYLLRHRYSRALLPPQTTVSDAARLLLQPWPRLVTPRI